MRTRGWTCAGWEEATRCLILSEAHPPTAFGRSSGDDDVVDLEDEADALGRERDGRGVNEERHEHILLKNVGHLALAHVYA